MVDWILSILIFCSHVNCQRTDLLEQWNLPWTINVFNCVWKQVRQFERTAISLRKCKINPQPCSRFDAETCAYKIRFPQTHTLSAYDVIMSLLLWESAIVMLNSFAKMDHQTKREMEQQKLFSGCLLRRPVMGFGSSLTRISETNDFAWPVFPCRLLGLQWHILIPEPWKRSLIMHSDGSAKHEAIMKLQHSHVVLAGGCTVQTHWSHCRTKNYWQCYRNADASWKWCIL